MHIPKEWLLLNEPHKVQEITHILEPHRHLDNLFLNNYFFMKNFLLFYFYFRKEEKISLTLFRPGGGAKMPYLAYFR